MHRANALLLYPCRRWALEKDAKQTISLFTPNNFKFRLSGYMHHIRGGQVLFFRCLLGMHHYIIYIYIPICSIHRPQNNQLHQCTEVRFASIFSGGFITAVVVNQPERKLAKRTSVQWPKNLSSFKFESQLIKIQQLQTYLEFS